MPEKVVHRACLSVELNMHPNRQTLTQECSQTFWQFPGHFVFICPRVCMFACSSSCHEPHTFPEGAREPSFWVCPLGARIPSRAGGYCPRGAGAFSGMPQPICSTMRMSYTHTSDILCRAARERLLMHHQGTVVTTELRSLIDNSTRGLHPCFEPRYARILSGGALQYHCVQMHLCRTLKLWRIEFWTLRG